MGQGPGNQAFRRYTSTASTRLGQGPKLHKREGKRLPVRNRQSWQVLSSRERRLQPPPTQGRTSDPEDAGSLPGFRGASSRLVPRSSAPSTPQGGLELERSWGSWRSGAKGQVRVRKRIPARIPGARGSHLSSRAEALRGTQRAASAELKAHGPRLGRRPLECPESSSASWAQAAVAGARARAGAAVRSSPSPGAGRLCARGAPPAAASSGCCSRRRLPLLLHRRPLPAFPAGPEAAAESRSG